MSRKPFRSSAVALLVVLSLFALPTSVAWARPADDDGGGVAAFDFDASGWLSSLWKSLTSFWSVDKATVTDSTSTDPVIGDPIIPDGGGGQTDCTSCGGDEGGTFDPEG